MTRYDDLIQLISKESSHCILWPYGKSTTKNGQKCYGGEITNPLGKPEKPHRIAYAINYGKIPNGLMISHLCMNSQCVNPKHLIAATAKENYNMPDAGVFASATKRKLKEECRNGHQYTEESIGWTMDKRYCKICKREQNRNSRKRHRLDH